MDKSSEDRIAELIREAWSKDKSSIFYLAEIKKREVKGRFSTSRYEVFIIINLKFTRFNRYCYEMIVDFSPLGEGSIPYGSFKIIVGDNKFTSLYKLCDEIYNHVVDSQIKINNHILSQQKNVLITLLEEYNEKHKSK